MPHPWSDAQLYVIRKQHPDLVEREVPPLDWVVVEFLKEHDVDAKPVDFNSRTAGEVAMSGLMGAMGTFETAAWHGLKGQEKQVKAQEWTSWKQWALSHADFPAFKEKHIGAARQHNEEIERRLNEPVFVEEWKAKLAQSDEQVALAKAKSSKAASWAVLALLAFVLGFVVVIDAASKKQLQEKDQRSDSSLVLPSSISSSV